MARPPRLQIPGGTYHVTARSIDRRAIFEHFWECNLFLKVLSDEVRRQQWLCHEYCLMPNHYHLILETPLPNLAAGMQRVNGFFAQTFNRQHERTGHVFERRYRAALIESDAHLLELTRYVILNPVRAGICGLPEHWCWSGYRARVGLTPRPPFLTTTLLELFANDTDAARAGYVGFVRDREPPERLPLC